MMTLKIATSFLIAFNASLTGLVARDTENTTALVGLGVLLMTDLLSIICIWG